MKVEVDEVSITLVDGRSMDVRIGLVDQSQPGCLIGALWIDDRLFGWQFWPATSGLLIWSNRGDEPDGLVRVEIVQRWLDDLGYSVVGSTTLH
ncbi:MAG: hypothetical protein KF889_04820 [Alphaproteobacteria bacterium]|nr:hypothetical protein [Alphaproteobacteria bacterium]MCW5742191.1 hypothetical protein [Alphaproteobacteria bacterium]